MWNVSNVEAFSVSRRAVYLDSHGCHSVSSSIFRLCGKSPDPKLSPPRANRYSDVDIVSRVVTAASMFRSQL